MRHSDFKKVKKFHGFCADLFRRYSQLTAKPKFGHRPVGSGAAWRRSPHQKSAGRERKGKEGRKEREMRRKKRGEKGKKGRGEQETEKDV